MADKYIYRDANTGNLTEREAIDTSAGAADAGKIPALNADGEIDSSMLGGSVGGGLSRYEIFDGETVEVPAGHNFLLAGDLQLDGELRVDGRVVEVLL